MIDNPSGTLKSRAGRGRAGQGRATYIVDRAPHALGEDGQGSIVGGGEVDIAQSHSPLPRLATHRTDLVAIR